MIMVMKNIIKKIFVVKIWGVCCSFLEKFRKILIKLMGVGGEKRVFELNVLKNVFLKMVIFFLVLLIWLYKRCDKNIMDYNYDL